jgi:histidine phosphotransfer protein HptB
MGDAVGIEKYEYIDPSNLLEALDGDWGAVASLAQTYLDNAPDIFAKLQRGLDSGNTKTVWHESHALKGMAALLGANGLANMLLRTEQAARNEQLPSESERNELCTNFNNTMTEVLHCVKNAMKA